MATAKYEDLLYEEQDGVATITVNRPEALNAFRPGTYVEVADAIRRAGWNPEIGVIVLTGAGSRAFGVGGDSRDRKWERAGRGTIGVPVEDVHAAIREVRGRGLLIGVDLAGTPTETVDAVLDGAREQGVLIGSTGARFDVLKIRPPLVVTQPQVERIAEVVADVVARTVSSR